MNKNFKDISGKTYGRLKVLYRTENDKYGNAQWVCICECGNKTTVKGYCLRMGKTKSCGCLQKDTVRNREYKHGYTGTRIYSIWSGMKDRCLNSNSNAYKDYGAKGIKVCDEWLKAENFIKWAFNNGYKDVLTIERIDSNGNYEPSNCTFTTRSDQNRNTSRNIKQIISGKEYTLSQIAKMLGVTRGTVCRWYHKEGLRNEELIQRHKDIPEKYKNLGGA